VCCSRRANRVSSPAKLGRLVEQAVLYVAVGRQNKDE
jgi:hypothetical protein